MTEPTKIVDDSRPIRTLAFEGEGDPRISLDDADTDRIVAYEEPGIYGSVTWFAVYKGGEIKSRWPSWMCGVVYAD